MLLINNISFHYNKEEPVLESLSFAVTPGETWALLGPNGSGKTTLMRLILGLEKPKEGAILIEDKDTLLWKPRERAKKIAYVPQNYFRGEAMTVFDAVLLGRRPYINWGPSKGDINKTCEVMELLGLMALSQREIATLSGGQRQKVVLARALAQDTPYLLLDEPTGNLDLKHQVEVLELLALNSKEKLKGVIIAMHDINLAAHFASKVVLMGGTSTLCGKTSDILNEKNLTNAFGIAMCSQERKDSGEKLFFPVMSRKEAPEEGTVIQLAKRAY
ncbi:MAG: ABC transporter ATP-binding protein [Deltaproteobacteria bacterium]|jgi:iron complex transport system ATP-binding protein|nr:ABC transporter ATP-binding protein [Deltaproteobacteria bacterium]